MMCYIKEYIHSSQGKAQTKMGRQCYTRYLTTEYQKLDSLCPRSNKMEKRCWEGQNF